MNVKETLPSGDRATRWMSRWVFPVSQSSKFPVEAVSLLQSGVVMIECQQFGECELCGQSFATPDPDCAVHSRISPLSQYMRC